MSPRVWIIWLGGILQAIKLCKANETVPETPETEAEYDALKWSTNFEVDWVDHSTYKWSTVTDCINDLTAQ